MAILNGTDIKELSDTNYIKKRNVLFLIFALSPVSHSILFISSLPHHELKM